MKIVTIINMKRVIITGVTGQDGSYMADYLLENTDYKNMKQDMNHKEFIGAVNKIHEHTYQK